MDKIASKRYELLLSLAKQQSRPQLEKELNKARKDFSTAQSDFNVNLAEFRAAQEKLEDARDRMNNSRKKILEITKFVQTMDLTGASAINQRGDSVNYVMDGKEYHIDSSNLDNIHKIPWKEYKKMLDSKKST